MNPKVLGGKNLLGRGEIQETQQQQQGETETAEEKRVRRSATHS